MSKNNKWAMDPSMKENIKTKINAEIQKMKIAESKGDNEAIEKIMILKERIRLIDSYRPFDETRIANLQKIFKHYCTHIFKTGKNMSFDRIEYENQHMTLERFFALINDFKLNEIPVDDNNKQLTHPNNIILIFKKCSYNARNLEFHQFVICVERVFTLLFNQTQNYDRRQQKLQGEKKKRAEQAKKREKLKGQKKKKISENKPVQQQNKQQAQEEEQQEQQEVKVQEAKIKQTKKTSQQAPPPAPASITKNSQVQIPLAVKSTQNDDLVNEMMKNFEIVNPTDEVKKAVKQIKKGDKKQEDEQSQPEAQIVFDPYSVTDQQKIESYMLRLGVDNWKALQKRMRYFQKANHTYDEKINPLEEAMKIKQQKLKVLKKDELTHYQNAQLHQQWKGNRKNHEQNHARRLLSVRDKIEEIKMQKSKSYMKQSLPKEIYVKKKKSILQTFERKQRQLMVPYALQRITKRRQQFEESSLNFSLQMISRSTPNSLRLNKINPQRYAIPDPTDRIYMQQFGHDSFFGMKKPARNDLSLAQETKKRAQQLQNQEQKKMNRLSKNMYKKQQLNRELMLQKKN